MMHRQMTITLDAAVYDALHRTMSEQQMRQFIKNLVRSHVLMNTLDVGYQAMVANSEREAAAIEWCNALAQDVANESPLCS